MEKLSFFILVLFLVLDIGSSRFINTNSTSELVSDGLSTHVDQTPYLSLNPITTPVTCEPYYGFLPCAPNLWGELFLIVVYEFLLYLGDTYITSGSELLFRILGPGIFGASAFHILGALPGATIVLVTIFNSLSVHPALCIDKVGPMASGISGSTETAQALVVSGVAALAGSTVLLLTLLWGTCVVVGKVDISKELSSLDKAAKPLDFIGSGVTTDPETRYTARIMLLSTIPFIIAELPHVLGSSSGHSVATLIALVVSLSFLCIYCVYQVFQPWIQNRRLEYMMHKFVDNNFLKKFLTVDGEPNLAIIRDMFKKFDQNNDKYVTAAELKGLMLGIQFQEEGVNTENFAEMVFNKINFSGDGHVDEEEFVRGISKWLSDSRKSSSKKIRRQWHLQNDSSEEAGEEQPLLMNQETEKTDSVKAVDNLFWSCIEAASLLLIGICILALLSRPLIVAVVGFSSAANVPSIFISFTLVPLAVNYRTARTAITLIQERIKQSASLTLSEIYTAVFMNHIIGVSIFLGIIYARGLTWNFSAEVIVVLIVCIVMGLFTSFCNTFPLWSCFIAYLLYPFSLMLVYVLTYMYGWA
ncbi:hypothetical protein IFM89_022636 [Coptis chinensis]|uniref:EF-hand domain-containing protein n=1 Tax=Coptis chinensis TaxID=261450 RepID=A0A835GYS9_9MAGN|nr:hypothetical protein IFM89_022636 [Coptis chinensis]